MIGYHIATAGESAETHHQPGRYHTPFPFLAAYRPRCHTTVLASYMAIKGQVRYSTSPPKSRISLEKGWVDEGHGRLECEQENGLIGNLKGTQIRA
ncbi:hypothetical protein HOY82DRAFT_577798 [Tuber indicum]|nr:hypothetical protein HOY82DRAFT_577798 [Tuber indicum]